MTLLLEKTKLFVPIELNVRSSKIFILNFLSSLSATNTKLAKPSLHSNNGLKGPSDKWSFSGLDDNTMERVASRGPSFLFLHRGSEESQRSLLVLMDDLENNSGENILYLVFYLCEQNERKGREVLKITTNIFNKSKYLKESKYFCFRSGGGNAADRERSLLVLMTDRHPDSLQQL